MLGVAWAYVLRVNAAVACPRFSCRVLILLAAVHLVLHMVFAGDAFKIAGILVVHGDAAKVTILLLELPHGYAAWLGARFIPRFHFLILNVSGNGFFEYAAGEFYRVDCKGNGLLFDLFLHDVSHPVASRVR